MVAEHMKPVAYAAYRQISRSLVYRLINKGMPSVRIGGCRRIKTADADAWIESGNANAKGAGR